MEFEEFSNNCFNKKCLKRQRFDEKTCIRKTKQANCHKAYERLEAKKVQKFQDNIEQWNEQAEFDNEVWLRDTGEIKGESSNRENWKKYCRIWNILTVEEKAFLSKDEEMFLNQKLEIAHIKPKSTNLDLVHSLENCVLVGHSFHRRLTDMLHPVYKTSISSEEVEEWLLRAKDKKRY